MTGLASCGEISSTPSRRTPGLRGTRPRKRARPRPRGRARSRRRRIRPAQCSVSVDEVIGELRVELTGDGAVTGAAVAVGLARVLNPQQRLGASAHLIGGTELHAGRVAPLVVV